MTVNSVPPNKSNQSFLPILRLAASASFNLASTRDICSLDSEYVFLISSLIRISCDLLLLIISKWRVLQVIVLRTHEGSLTMSKSVQRSTRTLSDDPQCYSVFSKEPFANLKV